MMITIALTLSAILSSLSAISYSDRKYPKWFLTSSEKPGERILATIVKRNARTLCLGTFFCNETNKHESELRYNEKLQ